MSEEERNIERVVALLLRGVAPVWDAGKGVMVAPKGLMARLIEKPVEP